MFPRFYGKYTIVLMCWMLMFGLGLAAALPVQGQTAERQKLKIVVRQGDTLWDLALKYDADVDKLAADNGILKPDLIHVGQTLYMEQSENPGTQSAEVNNIVSRGEEKAGLTREDVDLLARLIYAEARGEDFEGQVAVGAVVLNRLENPHFPKTLSEVVYQPGQFTAVNDKQIQLEPDSEAYRAAEKALAGMDPTGGAIYYFNPRLAKDRWITTRQVLTRIGNHTFSI